MKILAIETSCDETAISIAEFSSVRGQLRTKKPRTDADSGTRIKILSNIISSQVKLHAKFGGVVPNLAKREHQRNLVPILLHALKDASFLNYELGIKNNGKRTGGVNIHNSKFIILNSVLEREPELFARMVQKVLPLKPPPIDAIAVTYGPGLAPALWVGVNFAKALSYLWNKPLIPVNHMEGHLYSALLQINRGHPERGEGTNYGKLKRSFGLRPQDDTRNNWFTITNIKFPALALLVSGGHTELVLMRGHGKFKVIGETLDDAAGEAFDKVARLLGLPYPGGPAISALAETEIPNSKFQIPNKFKIQNSKFKIKLPRPMINSKDYNFSFSGLRTAVLYLIQDLIKQYSLAKIRQPIAYEFQNAVVDVLVSKTICAAKEYKVKTVLLGGGVAANKLLRKRLTEELKRELQHSTFYLPQSSFTGDNALMVAIAAHYQWASHAQKGRAAYFGKNKKTAWKNIQADANLKLS